jgi:hypothetical protein
LALLLMNSVLSWPIMAVYLIGTPNLSAKIMMLIVPARGELVNWSDATDSLVWIDPFRVSSAVVIFCFCLL